MTDLKPLALALAVLLAIAVLGMGVGGAMMGPGVMGPGMMWGYGSPASGTPPVGWSWGLGMAVGWLAMLAFWGALIVGIALLVRWIISSSRASGPPSREEDPLTILRRRYASGEIDEPTYQRMRDELQASRR